MPNATRGASRSSRHSASWTSGTASRAPEHPHDDQEDERERDEVGEERRERERPVADVQPQPEDAGPAALAVVRLRDELRDEEADVPCRGEQRVAERDPCSERDEGVV